MRAQPTPACFFVVCCAFALVLVSAESGWKPSELPSPQHDRRDVCRRGKKSAVCDPDSILALSERDELDGLINFIAEGTNGYEIAPCGSRYEGYQLAVLIINRMSSGYYPFRDSAQRAKRFAKDIHDKWGVGDAECHNGVVIFVSIDDRQMYISTGKGTKMVLTDPKVQSVLAHMKPYMREELYGRALLSAVHRIGSILSGKAVPEDESSGGELVFFSLFGFIFLTCCCLGGAQSVRQRRKYSKCKAALKRIDDDTVSARNGTYRAKSCPICLEDFETSEEKKSEDEVPLIASNKKDDNPRVALPCGHVFHEKCILEWTEGEGGNRSTCPVCRRPVDGGETSPEPPGNYSGFEEERNFRIMRAHYLYPDFVSYSMAQHYARDSTILMQSHSDFVNLDPVVLAEARSAGHGGSTFSFGGSSSAGGGGGGSSW